MISGPCVICGSEQFTEVCTADEIASHLQYLRNFHRRRIQSRSREALADRAAFTQDYVTNVVACDTCHLVLRRPRPPTLAITSAYSRDHYGPERLNVLYAEQLRSYRKKARALRRWLPRERRARVVEVGSFVGGFLAAGQEYGWEMLGVDPGEEVDTFCHAHGLPVFRGTLPQLPCEAQSIDGVAIWNTFDQLPHPRETVAKVCQLLRPGGMLVLRVPNGECFRWAVSQLRTLSWPWAGVLRSMLAWNNLLAFPYLYGYSPGTLDRLLTGYGFARVATHHDTLMPLADAQTKWWARAEEYLLKNISALTARVEQFYPEQYPRVVPWLDLYYQMAQTD